MSTPPTEGRLKIFRLSDVPPDVRLAALRSCVTAEIRDLQNPLDAFANVALLEAIADDPADAARRFPDDCRNDPHVVPLAVWERATRPRGRR